MRLATAAIAFAAALSAAQAVEPIPSLGSGMPYASARGTLIAKGFRPVGSNGDLARCPAGRQDVCSAYPETVSCSTTGNAACRFIFTSAKGDTVTVVADGQDVGKLKVVESRRSAKRDVEWQKAGR